MESRNSFKERPLQALFGWHDDCLDNEQVERDVANDTEQAASPSEERVDD